jgi:hypothetical protein
MGNEPTNLTNTGGSTASAQQPATALDHQEILPVQRSWKFAGVIAGIMVLLALLGVAFTTTSRAAAPAYWVSLAPIFGVLCAGTAWARHPHAQGLRREEIIRQVLHWLAVAVALGLDFLVRGTGDETGHAAGLNAMLLLAMGCFLAGVHLEWHFAIVGLLLSLALIVVAKAEQYVWLIFVVGALAVAALFGLRWLLQRTHHPVRTPRAAPSSGASHM